MDETPPSLPYAASISAIRLAIAAAAWTGNRGQVFLAGDSLPIAMHKELQGLRALAPWNSRKATGLRCENLLGVIQGTLHGDLVLIAQEDPPMGGRVGADGTLQFKDDDHIYAAGNPHAWPAISRPHPGARSSSPSS